MKNMCSSLRLFTVSSAMFIFTELPDIVVKKVVVVHRGEAQ